MTASTRPDSARSKVSAKLDALEDRLPGLPQRALRLNRAAFALGCGLVSRATRSIEQSGQAVASTAETGARTVVGQAEAQAEHVIGEVVSETNRLADDAATIAEDLETGSYASWTRGELYERAKELDVEGRSSMNKAQLIDAVSRQSTR